ncbi:methyltransferase domain-containing protein [Amycolatopsis rhizosphaerae]|uniref:Protein-L-isoaspartate O-methyltransferase n=1 Tax=Amycolatopsis rhizosphaerae TaxID=2053003 RepID=A0A558C4W2_9PSEU|nr:methyltransferase domain-containing protein [Amycolatopsis rhizosphaerae]TVT43828.1 methyltransferase domain-containing protein [Amycolatopsis rhizosphaerae]
MSETVAAAAAATDYDSWVKTEDGGTIPQSSAAKRISAILETADIQPGMNVLEIGTGSGYSGALLSHLVRDHGRVVSIDVDSSLTDRAALLHSQAGHHNIEVHPADGFAGWEAAAPFDRILAWTTPHVLPQPWVQQATQGGVIVTPVKIADIACANATIRCTVRGDIEDGSVYPGSFIEMAPEVVTDLAVPIRFVDATRIADNQPSWWISAQALHGQPDTVARALLDQAHEAAPRPGFFVDGRVAWEAFTTYVLARSPHPASVGGAHGWGIGVAVADSVAVVLPDGGLLVAGSRQAHDELHALLTEWIELGKPHHERLQPVFTPDPEGWSVRVKLRDLD